MSGSGVTREVINFVLTELLSAQDEDALGADDDLLGSGLVDSLGVMRLIQFIERRFDVAVPPVDVTIENFMTASTITGYLATRGIHDGTSLVD